MYISGQSTVSMTSTVTTAVTTSSMGGPTLTMTSTPSTTLVQNSVPPVEMPLFGGPTSVSQSILPKVGPAGQGHLPPEGGPATVSQSIPLQVGPPGPRIFHPPGSPQLTLPPGGPHGGPPSTPSGQPGHLGNHPKPQQPPISMHGSTISMGGPAPVSQNIPPQMELPGPGHMPPGIPWPTLSRGPSRPVMPPGPGQMSGQHQLVESDDGTGSPVGPPKTQGVPGNVNAKSQIPPPIAGLPKVQQKGQQPAGSTQPKQPGYGAGSPVGPSDGQAEPESTNARSSMTLRSAGGLQGEPQQKQQQHFGPLKPGQPGYVAGSRVEPPIAKAVPGKTNSGTTMPLPSTSGTQGQQLQNLGTKNLYQIRYQISRYRQDCQ